MEEEVGKPQSDLLDLDEILGNAEGFNKFIEKMGIVEFKVVDNLFLKKRFKGLGCISRFTQSSIFDHARVAKTEDRKYILILQPYLSTEECLSIMRSSCVSNKYDILGKSASWHLDEGTNLVVIYEDS